MGIGEKTHRNNAGLILPLLLALLAAGCGRPESVSQSGSDKAEEPSQESLVAVSSSYLEAALRDVMPRNVPLVRLGGPALCPGHFDVRPSQMSDLAKCRLFVRFDFQQAFDQKFSRQDGGPLQTLSVSVTGGMCVPESYLSTCRQLADHFITTGELSRAEAEHRLSRIAERMAKLHQLATERIERAGLQNASVLTSGHQAGFCQWLGMRVAAVFSGPDTASTRQIEQAASAGEKSGVRIIIANEPEGRRLADALADRLRAKVVVFANFPEPGKAFAFDAMIQRNLNALFDAVHTPLEQR